MSALTTVIYNRQLASVQILKYNNVRIFCTVATVGINTPGYLKFDPLNLAQNNIVLTDSIASLHLIVF